MYRVFRFAPFVLTVWAASFSALLAGDPAAEQHRPVEISWHAD